MSDRGERQEDPVDTQLPSEKMEQESGTSDDENESDGESDS